MIIYNFPYRGPLEYEKFVLNYMQLSNEVTNLINIIEASNVAKYSKKINQEFDNHLKRIDVSIYSNFL